MLGAPCPPAGHPSRAGRPRATCLLAPDASPGPPSLSPALQRKAAAQPSPPPPPLFPLPRTGRPRRSRAGRRSEQTLPAPPGRPPPARHTPPGATPAAPRTRSGRRRGRRPGGWVGVGGGRQGGWGWVGVGGGWAGGGGRECMRGGRAPGKETRRGRRRAGFNIWEVSAGPANHGAGAARIRRGDPHFEGRPHDPVARRTSSCCCCSRSVSASAWSVGSEAKSGWVGSRTQSRWPASPAGGREGGSGCRGWGLLLKAQGVGFRVSCIAKGVSIPGAREGGSRSRVGTSACSGERRKAWQLEQVFLPMLPRGKRPGQRRTGVECPRGGQTLRGPACSLVGGCAKDRLHARAAHAQPGTVRAPGAGWPGRGDGHSRSWRAYSASAASMIQSLPMVLSGRWAYCAACTRAYTAKQARAADEDGQPRSR